MRKAVIVGGGVAGPVAAMALQRAGIEGVVYEAYPQTAEEVGSYLTVASNGLDALRAIGADGPVRAAGFPTLTNLLLSSGAGHAARSTGAPPLAGSCPADTTHGMNQPDLPRRPTPTQPGAAAKDKPDLSWGGPPCARP